MDLPTALLHLSFTRRAAVRIGGRKNHLRSPALSELCFGRLSVLCVDLHAKATENSASVFQSGFDSTRLKSSHFAAWLLSLMRIPFE